MSIRVAWSTSTGKLGTFARGLFTLPIGPFAAEAKVSGNTFLGIKAFPSTGNRGRALADLASRLGTLADVTFLIAIMVMYAHISSFRWFDACLFLISFTDAHEPFGA